MAALKDYSCGGALRARRGVNADSVSQFTPRGNDLARPFPATRLAFELAELDSGGVAWAEACFLQVVAVDDKAMEDIIRKVFGMRLIARAGAKHRRRSNAGQPGDGVETS